MIAGLTERGEPRKPRHWPFGVGRLLLHETRRGILVFVGRLVPAGVACSARAYVCLLQKSLDAREESVMILPFLASFLSAAVLLAEPLSADQSADPTRPSDPPKGFVALFNGKDLTGWKGLGHYDPAKYRALSPEDREALDTKNAVEFEKHWRVENGELVNDGKGPYATTVKDYGDFELLIEYKTIPKADSGVYLRGIPQVQIWDTTEEGGNWKLGADKGSGALWNNKGKGRLPLVHADKPFGRWNTLKIKMVGDRVTVHLNGMLTVDDAPLENYWNRKKPAYSTGPIQLQTHGGEIRWRNIFLREIPREKSEEATAPVAKPNESRSEGV